VLADVCCQLESDDHHSRSMLGIELTVRHFRAVRVHRSIRKVAALLDGIVLGVATPRDTFFLQQINDGSVPRSSEVDRVIRVPAKSSGSNVAKVVWLLKTRISIG
jgi:hypothetical protein